MSAENVVRMRSGMLLNLKKDPVGGDSVDEPGGRCASETSPSRKDLHCVISLTCGILPSLPGEAAVAGAAGLGRGQGLLEGRPVSVPRDEGFWAPGMWQAAPVKDIVCLQLAEKMDGKCSHTREKR